MAVTTKPYGYFGYVVGQGNYRLTNTNVYIWLLNSSYTPDYVNHKRATTDFGNAELPDGNGYTAGGQRIYNVNLNYSYSTGLSTLTADPASWTGLTGTVRYAMIVGPSNYLIGCIDFGADRVFNNQPLQVSFPTGIITFGYTS